MNSRETIEAEIVDETPSPSEKAVKATRTAKATKAAKAKKDSGPTTSVSNLSAEGFVAAVMAGMVLDTADLLTMLGGRAGLIIGAVAALYLCYDFRIKLKRWPWFAALGAAYCMMPMTFLIPVATTLSLTNYAMRAFGVLDEWRKSIWKKIG